MSPISSVDSVRFALFDQIPLGLCVLDNELRVLFWNICLEEWTQISRREVLGQDISEHLTHLGEPAYRDRLATLFDGGPPALFSSQLHPHFVHAPLPDGTQRIFHTLATAIPSGADSGSLFHALLSIQDVTDLGRRVEDFRRLRDQAMEEMRERQRAEKERRRLETKVQHAQKLESLGVLAGGIAHDFNNLLVGILGNSDLAREEVGPDSPAHALLERVIRSAQQAAELSNQMLAYSGRGSFLTRPLNLSQWAHDMVRLLKISISPQALLRCKFPPHLPTIEGDPAQIRQLVTHLVTNSSDSLGDDSGLITVSTGTVSCEREMLAQTFPGDDLPAGSYVYLEVSDTGCGMDAETLEKIFDPFFSTKFTGRGLGLAAVLGIVRGHGGTLDVSSEPGQGTSFRVLFPISRREEVVVRRRETVGPPWRGSGTVLVIDDEEMVRALASAGLERAGFEVELADGGQQGIEIFQNNPARFVLVLLDMTMPGLDGQQVCGELRKLRHDIPIILSSGFSEQQVSAPFSNEALPAFLQKPYMPADLVAKVREVLG